MYFTDRKFSIESKIGIDGLTGSFSNRSSSHKGSWPRMIKNQLKNCGYDNVDVLSKNNKWDNYDIIIIDWGMEYKGTFNLFGGANDELYKRIKQFENYTGVLLSLHIECPNVGKLVSDRYKTGTELFKTLNADIITEKCKSVGFIKDIFHSTKLVFGDSHSLSAYHPGYMISRNDGLTLYGALKRGLSNYIPDDVDDLVIYLSNIDIRFHLCRQKNPIDDTDNLIDEFKNQLMDLKINKIKIIAPLPIEFEGRKLPGTGLYNGKPFYGTRDERDHIREFITNILGTWCNLNNWEFFEWPKSWFEMDPEKYAKKCMEATQSVHLNRDHYIYNLETSELNKNLL